MNPNTLPSPDPVPGPAHSRFLPIAVLAGAYLAFGLVVRLVLFARFGVAQGVPVAHLPLLIAGGVVNDLVQSLYMLAPLALYLLAMRDRWFRSRVNQRLLAAATFLTIFALGFSAAAEFFFFEEFDARFNIVAVDYLMFPTEVAGDVWAEYPVLWVSGFALLVAALLTRPLMRLMSGSFLHSVRLARRLPLFLAYGICVALAAFWYRTDELSFAANRVENELVQNGMSSFFRALATSEIDYHAYYPVADSRDNFALLAERLAGDGGRFTDLADGRLTRSHAARPDGLGRLNVVVVSSESFGAEFSKLHGSERDLTPEFDKLAAQGMWFSNAYASGTRTVRGLEAITASFPPIPTVSILRRPGNEHIANWGAVMRDLGYDASFLYGGYGYFDNMRYFYAQNGFEVLDRSDIHEPVRFENMWGVSDEDLFDLALGHFDAKAAAGVPFFSIVMTTSNHKPFTFRAGVPGVPESGGGRKAGVRYADFALGYFLTEAKKHAWFDNTVFVIVADHGARVYGKAEIPLRTYEIPLLIYSPGHIAPQEVETLMGQVDIAPTVLGLLGLPYEAPFFGQDVLHTPDAERIALFSHNHDIAIYRDGRLTVLGLNSPSRTFSYDRATDSYAPLPLDREQERLAIAYYQTAYELFSRHAY